MKDGRWLRSFLALLGWIGLAPPAPRVWLTQDREDNCSQTVMAMLSGLSVKEVASTAGHEGAMTVAETLAILARLGFHARPVAARLAADFWPSFRARNGGRKLRGMGFRRPIAGENYGHAYLLHGSHVYDPANGRFGPLDPQTIRALDWVVLLQPVQRR